MRKASRLAGVLIAATDREDAGADHIGERVGDARGITAIGKAARQSLGDPESAFRHGEQHDAAIRRNASAIERSCDFLALDGWKRESGKRILCHGGRGRPVEAERPGVSNRILRRFSALCYARQPTDNAVMNMMVDHLR